MEEEVTKKIKEQTLKEREKVSYVYSEVKYMLDDVMNQSYTKFNDRTLKQYLDDNQKRANSYVPSREEQGKAEWQANFFSKTTRNKVKALIAGIAKNPPDVSISAFDERNQQSIKRGEIMNTLVEASFVTGDKNPQLEMYMDSWNCTINGTVVKYDGYLKTKDTVRIVTDYDPTTGEVEFEEREEIIEDECIEIDIPLQNFLIRDPYIRNVQDQPAIAWVEYIDKDKLEYEYGNFKNFDKIKSGKALVGREEIQTFFKAEWDTRTKENQYEVIKYFRKYGKDKDIYRIVINGVLILDTPLLWGRKKKKYPFATTIFEPFANSKFFWGNSLPNILMGEQDVENAFVNSMTDLVYRDVTTPLLVGMINKDNFDLEDEYVDNDTRIYVEDVSQVTPMPTKGISNGAIQMLQFVKAGMDDDSTDKVQGGASGSGSTAREIVIANERAEELKGLFFILMTDLWVQKYRLRIINTLMNYSTPKIEAVVGEDGVKETEEVFKVFRVSNVELSDGRQGNKQIEVVNDDAALTGGYNLDVRETEAEIEGQQTEITQITRTYLDDYDYVVKVETEGLYQKSKALKMAMMNEKLQIYATLFPQIFMANQNEFFKMTAETYGDDPEKYLEGMQSQMPPGMPGQLPPGQSQGQPVPETAPMGQLPKI